MIDLINKKLVEWVSLCVGKAGYDLDLCSLRIQYYKDFATWLFAVFSLLPVVFRVSYLDGSRQLKKWRPLAACDFQLLKAQKASFV